MAYEQAMREIARNLVQMHGKLVEVRCISGHHPCCIEMVFADGHKIVVGEHDGRVDITMMKFGYHGTGTQCFHAFLDEAGIKVSLDELYTMQGPKTLRPSKREEAE
jgi:hypothetical protein